jgi:hypothetical protein
MSVLPRENRAHGRGLRRAKRLPTPTAAAARHGKPTAPKAKCRIPAPDGSSVPILAGKPAIGSGGKTALG